jgi:hypothetical protein
MTESLLLALTGGVLGIVLAEGTLLLVKHLGPESIPHPHEIGLDLSVLAFALGITVITGILFGLAPAFGATRMNLVEALKEGGQRSGGSASVPDSQCTPYLASSAGADARRFRQFAASHLLSHGQRK